MKLYEAGVSRSRLVRPKTMTPSEWHKEVLALKELYPNEKYPYRVYKRKNQNAYDIRISLPESLCKFYMYLYDDVDESIYMERKHYKFHNALFKNNISIKDRKTEKINTKSNEYRISIEDKEKINTEFYENEMSINDIAKKSGLSKKKIIWNLGKFN